MSPSVKENYKPQPSNPEKRNMRLSLLNFFSMPSRSVLAMDEFPLLCSMGSVYRCFWQDFLGLLNSNSQLDFAAGSLSAAWDMKGWDAVKELKLGYQNMDL